MILVEHAYASRVPMWLVKLLTYVLGLAILEAKNEGGNIASFVLAILSALFHLWYTAYVAWRLWSFIRNRSVPKPHARDYHSIGVWFDILFSLILVWAHLSQTIHIQWPTTFAVDTLPSNHWEAALHWIWNSADSVTANGTPFRPTHTGTRFLYSVIDVIQYLYLPAVFVVGLARVREHIKSKKNHRDIEEGSGPPTVQHASREMLQPSYFPRSNVLSAPPPSVYPSSGPIDNGDFASWYNSSAPRYQKPMELSPSDPIYDVYAWGSK